MSKNSQNYEVVVPDPILTSVFRWFAVFGILASLLVGVSAALSPVEHRVFLIYVTFGVVAFVILCFGIAEIIYKIAQIEFSALQGQAILDSLQKIERHLEGIRGGDEVNVVIKKVKSKKVNKEES